MHQLPSVDVVIVNRNSGKLLGECIASLAAAPTIGWTLGGVWVVDDASTDASALAIESVGKLPISVLRTSKHRGYGWCSNLGAAAGRSNYVLFLNTDVMVNSKSLPTAIEFLEDARNQSTGICGIQLKGVDGAVQRHSSRFPTGRSFVIMFLGLDRLLPSLFRGLQMKEWDHNSTRRVDQVVGAFMLMRRSLFELLGGYDERFFVYMEDLDLALRAAQRGYHCVYLASANGVHIGGGSARKVRAESLFFNMRSRIQYSFKHFGLPTAVGVSLGILVIEPVSRLVFAARRGSGQDAKASLVASFALWRDVLNIVRTLRIDRRAGPSGV